MKERPDDVEVVIALGNVQRSRKQFAEAAETYSKAIELIGTPDRGHWILFFYRGTSYERSKQWAKGEADLKKAMELVPDNLPQGKAQVLNYLAYSWVDQNINIDEAFKMLTRAVELAPRDGMIIDSLGWAYFRMGRYDEAVRELEKAVELKAGDPVINDHLGDAYWKVGRQARGEVPVEPRQGFGPRARRSGEDPQEDRQRHGRCQAGGRRREGGGAADLIAGESTPCTSSSSPTRIIRPGRFGRGC